MKSEEELKRYFMSIGLSLKFKFAEKLTNSNISIADLYTKAKENNIPMEDWHDFIFDEMQK